MKCPKCDYLSFEASDRCRNCGYDFALAIPRPPASDASLDAADESLQSLDLTLEPRQAASAVADEPAFDLDRLIGAPVHTAPDLPLFAQERREPESRDAADDPPLITPRAAPRAPLAVRRTVDTARMRALKRREEPVELALELAPDDRAPAPDPATDQTAPTIAWPRFTSAGWGRRLLAAIIDAAILVGIDLTVLYLTLRLCGLTLIEVGIVPLAPFAAFLVMLDGGYLIAFTAMGGQTIGKMAAGIQVVGDEGPVDFVHAALRAAGYVVSLLPAGLGVIPAFFGEGRRTLHDRLADTRVVRA